MKPKNNYYMHGSCTINDTENIFIFNSQEDTQLHKHDFIEIVYFLSGSGTHFINGEEYEISSGSLCLINTNVEHYYHIKNEKNGCVAVKNCIFYPKLLGEHYNSDNFIKELYRDLYANSYSPTMDIPSPYLCISKDRDKDYLSLLNIIEHELAQKKVAYMEIVTLSLRAFLLKLFREYSQNNTPILFPRKNIEILEEALLYIKTHYNETLSLSDVANRFYFSATYFNNLFKIYTGSTFKKYQQKLRCQKAAELLTKTSMPVYEICNEVGWSDPKQFFSLFKLYTGMSPGNYRKTSLNDVHENIDIIKNNDYTINE